MKSENTHEKHRQRLRAKFSRVGLDGFEDHEVLELLLTYAIARKDVNPIAHDLMNHFGSLNAVLNAAPEQLQEVDGIGAYAASLLNLIPQLAKRYLDEPFATKNYSMATAEGRISYFVPKFVGAKNECLYVALLNNNLEVITCKKVSEGSIDAIRIESRKLIDLAVSHKAHGIVLAHNHPSNPNPSMEDIATTLDVMQTLSICGIHVLDHIIVCRDGGLSLSKEGHLRHAR